MVFGLQSSTEQDLRYTEAPAVTKEGEYYISLVPDIYSRGKLPKVNVSMFTGGTIIELKAEILYSRMEGVKLARSMVAIPGLDYGWNMRSHMPSSTGPHNWMTHFLYPNSKLS